jgi:Homeodomain-like domain
VARPLDERHHSAAALLGRGASQAEAAEAAGVGRRTVQDWLRREDFAALVRDLREREAGSEPGALAKLRELLNSPDESIALRAAIELVRSGRGGRDPADDEDGAASGSGLLILDPSLLEDLPEPIDLAGEYEAWGGAEVTQAEADAHERGGAAFGDGWELR